MTIRGIHSWFESWVNPVSRFLSHIASFVLFLMMILTILDVCLRKAFSDSITGTVEVSEFMLVIVIFFGLAVTEVLNGHVKVDLVMGFFGKRFQAAVEIVTQLACFILMILVTWSAVIYSEKMRLSGQVSQDLWIPIYPFIYVIVAGCTTMALAILIKFFGALLKAVKS
ncbi:MAG: TRAP transporter small permease [Deltaproteobacteria bacterium]|nr:TRAP transporter small permease [Deltaproteobacteria bacterium]